MERIISFIKGADSEKVSNGLLTTSFLSVFVVFWLFSRFLKYNETRPGLALYDPILSSIGPYDHNLSIFLLTYGLVLFGLYWALQNRIGMLTTNLSICFLIAFRAFTLFSFPLEPPTGILPLQDLFLKNTFYCQEVLLKDLFFSCIFALFFDPPKMGQKGLIGRRIKPWNFTHAPTRALLHRHFGRSFLFVDCISGSMLCPQIHTWF